MLRMLRVLRVLRQPAHQRIQTAGPLHLRLADLVGGRPLDMCQQLHAVGCGIRLEGRAELHRPGQAATGAGGPEAHVQVPARGVRREAQAGRDEQARHGEQRRDQNAASMGHGADAMAHGAHASPA